MFLIGLPGRRHGVRTLCRAMLVVTVVVLAGCGSGGETVASRPASGDDSPTHFTMQPSRAQGRNACRGLTPLEAAKRFEQTALESGVRRRFVELVAEPPARVEASPSYPRLVAALYATTLQPSHRAQAAAGCAEELAAH
jgi:hypothetical protein